MKANSDADRGAWIVRPGGKRGGRPRTIRVQSAAGR